MNLQIISHDEHAQVTVNAVSVFTYYAKLFHRLPCSLTEGLAGFGLYLPHDYYNTDFLRLAFQIFKQVDDDKISLIDKVNKK